MPDVQVIPYRQLSPEALRGLILDVITREGANVHDTDSFHAESVVKRVLGDLDSGRVAIVFDNDHGSCNIVSTDDLAN